ncbi:Asp-tRNA(Asn)/Glu-tRNA(Gln) amidotransferase subunit GatC [[Acholeplasma] multilocale]|uniref:Asp-tRNA(Asn)/Glu-tRNA(Gln) amidotransferase subunit GatC n=1 Tax=[Acholeplasma] multilocale TaxID=264638 RepID=UPI0003FE3BB4|nr:hypothetical protein [[Acholeplasma] multilocale]
MAKNELHEIINILAEDIMLKLTEEEAQDIIDTESSIRQKFGKVTSIDTEGVKPLFYPFENNHTFLREDEEFIQSEQKDVLANAPTTDGDYITIVKVVK